MIVRAGNFFAPGISACAFQLEICEDLEREREKEREEGGDRERDSRREFTSAKVLATASK